MAEDSWQTYPIEFRGGLITNLSPLQQGINAPGSARILRNFEPSIEGGYKRILGYRKYDINIIPPYDNCVVLGDSQTGSDLEVASLYSSPEEGDVFTIEGVNGTYTITSVTYSTANKTAILYLDSALASSPANGALLTFTSTETAYPTKGVYVADDYTIVARGSSLYKTSGGGYTKISVPSYGSPLVNGASQTGGSLDIDGLNSAPKAFDVFTISGINGVYTVTSDATVVSGAATLSISPTLSSSPADDAAITFISTIRVSSYKTRFTDYNFSGVRKYAIVDGYNFPALYDGTTFTVLHNAPIDAMGAAFVIEHKNTLFFAKGSKLFFTAPYTDNDLSATSGGGIINITDNINGLKTFREQLFIFTESKIFQLSGSSIADFQLQPVTRDIGCIEPDSIQEVGSDVMFFAPDGLRLLGATDRVGDFNFANVTKVIQSEFNDLVNQSSEFCSLTVRGKSQYRLFGYNASYTKENAKGIIVTQLAEEGGSGYACSELQGIQAKVASSRYTGGTELCMFSNTDGYLYQMEYGSSFAGNDISSTFATPYLPISDPRIRKTIYKMFLYTDSISSININVTPKFDFSSTESIQPNSINLSNITESGNTIFYYGTATYGAANYAGDLDTTIISQLIGSGFTVSLLFETNDTSSPFTLDAVTLEYTNNSRR